MRGDTKLGTTSKRPPVRVNLRIPAALFDDFEAIAKRRYEGHLSMTAREALRLYIAHELPDGVAQPITARERAEDEAA